MEKPLFIPKNKRIGGSVVVYCQRCATNVYDTCKLTGKKLQQCPNGDRHSFKCYVHLKGSKNSRKTLTLATRDVDVAIREAIAFEQRVNNNFIYTPKEVKVEPKKELADPNKPLLFIDALGRYIGFLNNEGVPAHRQKIRSESHNKDVERILESFVECLNKNGRDPSNLPVDKLDDTIAGEYYSYLLNEKKFSARTFNKYLSVITSFFTWYSDEISPVKNYFERIKRKKTHYNPDTITREEFEALLQVITPENGVKEYESKEKPTRNLDRSYLTDAFKLALETGRRREEIIQLKFSDIVNDKSGVSYIKVEDFKVNRSQNRIDEGEKKFILIPITASLKELLYSLGYEQNIGTNNFLLAPEITGEHRTTQLSETMSRSFSHYYHIINPDKDLKFGCLRKTYISQLTAFMGGGGNAKSITGHSTDAVIEKHYADKKILIKAVNGFQVFPKEENRETQIEQIRNENTNQQNKERGIER